MKWEYKHKRNNNSSVLLHYFTRNMILGPDIFSLYGNNMFIFSIKNMKLHLCVDQYGYAINQFLLDKKIVDFFPLEYEYSEFIDVK